MEIKELKIVINLMFNKMLHKFPNLLVWINEEKSILIL